MYGIDISKHNGDINLEPYKGQFVIIRVGYGHFHLDEKFERNVAECKRLGIPFGVYHYSYALNEAEAEAEAKGVLDAIAKYKNDIKVGVWFDMEDADGYKKKHGFKFSNATIAPICYKFCKMIEDAGYYSGIYTSSSWLDYVKGLNDRFDKWVANWGKNDGSQHTNTSKDGTLQQYTSKPLDKNIMYAELSRYSRGGTEPTKPQPQPAHKPTGSENVRKAQNFLNRFIGAGLAVDGIRGSQTNKAVIKLLQKCLNLDYKALLAIDGIAGYKTMKALGNHYVKRGEDQYMVTFVECALYALDYNSNGIETPGYFGAGLYSAVVSYQKNVGLNADGIAGHDTLRSIIGKF